MVFVMAILTVKGQSSLDERTGFWTTGASWVGGTMPGTLSSGTVTVNGKVVVVNGTIQVANHMALNGTNLSVNVGDTLVILGNLNVTLTSFTNNGVIIVLGNLSNTLSNNTISGSGKLVVTGNYSNAFGANTFTGPSYVYGSTPGFSPAPPVGNESDLQTNDPDLYDYTNNIFNILPVELTSFEAKVMGESVTIAWATASEFNNDYFVVERSIDGAGFQALATLPGAGTSTMEHHYMVVDSFPAIGLSYYRVAQVDYDGKSVTFKAAAVQVKAPAQPEIYPNPTSRYVFINLNPEDYNIVLTHLNGHTVPQGMAPIEFNERTRLDLGRLGAGAYILHLVNVKSGMASRFRIVKQ